VRLFCRGASMLRRVSYMDFLTASRSSPRSKGDA
jgi:hypothetical protein